jgi:hypothetical protein
MIVKPRSLMQDAASQLATWLIIYLERQDGAHVIATLSAHPCICMVQGCEISSRLCFESQPSLSPPLLLDGSNRSACLYFVWGTWRSNKKRRSEARRSEGMNQAQVKHSASQKTRRLPSFRHGQKPQKPRKRLECLQPEYQKATWTNHMSKYLVDRNWQYQPDYRASRKN